jgi:hypothetical protein
MHTLLLVLLLATPQVAQPPQHPCRAAAYRQFDFWIGEWDVQIQGKKIATSSIQLILDGCVIFENYEDGTGYAGKSLTAWDAGEQRWEQHYTDTMGASRYFLGTFEDGKLVMRSEFDRQGKHVMSRMTYSKEGPDRVRQSIETSVDGGKTWTAGFNGLYVRRR